MAKFRSARSDYSRTENFAGGEAFKKSPELELVSLLLTSFVKDKFYENEGDQLDRLSELVKSFKDKRFPAKAGIYARNEFGMRSITHALAGEIVNQVKGEDWTKRFVSKVVRRPDDILEIFGYYLGKFGKPIPNSLKKGSASAIKKFDAYQLAKYRGTRSNVKMVDIFRLVHVKPDKDQANLFKDLVEGNLKSTNTWEAKLSKAGQEAKSYEEKRKLKEKAWADLILEGKIGYFALLRNLRNIHEQSDKVIDKALEMLTDRKRIKKSLVLPFRFVTAYYEISKVSGSQKILDAIDEALEISLDNVPKFDGDTLVVLDGSGSMMGFGEDGKSPIEVGGMFASVLIKSNKADFITFSDNAQYMNMSSRGSVMQMTKTLVDSARAGGTNFHAIFNTANRKYDRIIILSDMQGWIGYNTPSEMFNSYKRRMNANPHVYSFDLQGYGTLQFPEHQVYAIAGFSDKVFDIMKVLEKNKRALIKEIDKVIL